MEKEIEMIGVYQCDIIALRLQTMVTSLKPGPSLYLQEYSIIDGSSEVTHRVDTADAINVDVVTDGNETYSAKNSVE